MLLQISVLVSTVCFLYFYFSRTFDHWKNKNVKGPKPMPFFGNWKNVALRKQHMGMLYSEVYKQYPDEKVIGIYRMTLPTLIIRDLDIVKQILVKDFGSFPERGVNFSDEGLGQNIFHSNAETWKILRHRLTTVFTPSKFRSTFHLLADRGDKLAEYIGEITKNEPEQDVYQMILKHVFGITLVSVFGLDIDTANDTSSRLFDIFDENVRTTYSNELDMLFPGILTKLNLSILTDETIKICHKIVKAGVNRLPTNKSEINNTMDVLINLKKESEIHLTTVDKFGGEVPFFKITDELLAAQAWILFLAGYGNNSLSVTYALYHLAHEPDVQEKLIQEIDEVTHKYDGKLNYDAFNEIKYLEMVFEETLRMHPLTNAVVRSAVRDVKLDGTDIVIDKGTTVVMSPYAIQHDENNYPEPERFDPERFSPENVKGRHPCAFLSFGSGRRSCLGSRLARIQFGICLLKILSKFRVEPSKNTVSNIKYHPQRMLLTPEQRILLNFVPRTDVVSS